MARTLLLPAQLELTAHSGRRHLGAHPLVHGGHGRRVGTHPPHGRGGRSRLGHRRAGELTALRCRTITTLRRSRSVRDVGTGSARPALSSGTGCRTPRRLACECVPEPDSQSESSIVRHHELTALCQSPHTLLTQRDGLSISALELTALFESRHSENHIVLSSQKWV